MRKVITLTAAAWLSAVAGLVAQEFSPQTRTSLALPREDEGVAKTADSSTSQGGEEALDDGDGSDFTFSESQLDDDVDAAQTVSNVASTNNDPYHSEVGFRWSPMRFRVRALDNVYSTTFLNGLEMNDLELGRYNYSLLGGLNDVTRQKEGASGFENNSFGVTGLGGGDNINLRASHIAKGQKLTLTACNRNYKARALYTFGTGLLQNGWSFAASLGYRWADEGVIEGTFYNSLSYFLAVERRTGDLRHRVSLSTFGVPTERAQQGASTEEAYWLANSHYYNPNWGYQNGEKRNARVVRDFEPTTLLTWDWTISDNTRLSTTAAFKQSFYSSSSLGWAGEAYDPRPDYYKNMPSSIFNVYNPDKNNPAYLAENPFLVDAYQSLYDQWQEKANRQINWDRMYYVNQQNGESLYYLERRHNDQTVGALASTLTHTWAHGRLAAGIVYNKTIGEHYKTMGDLLGGSQFRDVNKFAAGDYGLLSPEAQSDLRHPNRYVGEGDRFGYDYTTHVTLEKLWAQYSYHRAAWSADLAGQLTGTQIERVGHMQNGQNPDHSLGSSGWAKFLGGGVRGKLTYVPYAGQTLSLAASWERKAPLARNAFVAPRVQNNFVDRLTLEDILGAEAAYQFVIGPVSGKVMGYCAQFDNAVEQTAFFYDASSAFVYLTMSGIQRQHYGVELALQYDILSNLSVHAMATYGEAQYTSNPYAQLTTEGMNSKDNIKVSQWLNPVTKENRQLRVAADGMRVGSTPLTALNIGVDYRRNFWFFELNANYYDRVYLQFSPYRRMSNVMTNYLPTATNADGVLTYEASRQDLDDNGGVLLNSDGSVHRMVAPKQEKFDGGWMIDASVGKSLRFRHGRSMSINLQLQNLLNNTNLRTGGYEQNRDDAYYNTYGTGDGSKGLDRAYNFSHNAKYYYANAFNFFLNANYRF